MTDRDALRKLVERVRNAERWDTDTIADEVAAIVDRLEKLEREHGWLRALIRRMEPHVVRQYVDGPNYVSGDYKERAFVHAQLDVTTSPEADDE